MTQRHHVILSSDLEPPNEDPSCELAGVHGGQYLQGHSTTSGKPASVCVVLDQRQPADIYRPGDHVTGDVVVSFSSTTLIYGIQIWIFGQSDVSFQEKSGSKIINETELYMKDCYMLCGKDPRKTRSLCDRFPLTSGNHRYHFSCPLPTNLPSSYHNVSSKSNQSNNKSKGKTKRKSTGRIWYTLLARVELTDNNRFEECEKSFIVLSRLDLNKESRNFSEPKEIFKQQRLQCCCCYRMGVIKCRLKLDRCSYVPGEDINVDAELYNESRRDVISTYVAMQQLTRLHGKEKRKVLLTDIFRVSGGRIRAGDKTFMHDIIHIPPLVPSRLQGCSLIDIEYRIAMGIKTVDCGVTQLSITVLVGTVPLKHILPRYGDAANNEPSFSRFNSDSGEIEDYNLTYRNSEFNDRYSSHGIYIYYKNLYGKRDNSTDSIQIPQLQLEAIDLNNPK